MQLWIIDKKKIQLEVTNLEKRNNRVIKFHTRDKLIIMNKLYQHHISQILDPPSPNAYMTSSARGVKDSLGVYSCHISLLVYHMWIMHVA